MTKKLVAKVGTYTNTNGEEKNQWMTIGVILSNDKGEYALLDPAVNLAGVMMKQRIADQKAGKKTVNDMLMCSIFDNDNQNSQPQRQGQSPGYEDDIPGW